MKRYNAWLADQEFGPRYDLDSAGLRKFRRTARKGVMKLDRFYREQYADAVEAAVLSAQRSQLKGYGEPQRRPNCASGTWHSDGDDIAAAIRAQQNRALLSCAALSRRARTPKQWQDRYDDAMREKREAAMTAKQRAARDSAVERQDRARRLAA